MVISPDIHSVIALIQNITNVLEYTHKGSEQLQLKSFLDICQFIRHSVKACMIDYKVNMFLGFEGEDK